MDRIYTGPLPLFGEGGESAEGEEGAGGGLQKPLFLLSDSQLLFWVDRGERFLSRVTRLAGDEPRAAYLGASNGDQPEYYDLFTGAMETAGIARCRMIPSDPSDADRAFVEAADVILLAGGSVERGWRAFQESGMRETLVQRYYAGAVLIGVSAGAVQLGVFGFPDDDERPEAAFSTLGLVPFAVSAHDEDRDWESLRRIVAHHGGAVRGLGIPRAGGIVYHADHTVEAVRHPAREVELRGGEVAMNLLLPVGG